MQTRTERYSYRPCVTCAPGGTARCCHRSSLGRHSVPSMCGYAPLGCGAAACCCLSSLDDMNVVHVRHVHPSDVISTASIGRYDCRPCMACTPRMRCSQVLPSWQLKTLCMSSMCGLHVPHVRNEMQPCVGALHDAPLGYRRAAVVAA